jgi:hypothetical protein
MAFPNNSLQASVFDVKSAFRLVPTLPEDRPQLMISWEGKVRFDNTFSFGARPAPGVFGRLADLLVHLLKFMTIEEILKWVDDFVFFRSPCGGSKGRFVYRYDEQIFFDLGDELGWIWESTKHTPFSSKFTHIGFDWDLDERTATLPEAKRVKYLAKLGPWTEGAKVTRKEAENLVGTLNHCALVLPQGRSRLVSLYRFTALFNRTRSPFVKLRVEQNEAKDVDWWRRELSVPSVALHIREPPPMEADEIYVDASTSWGIGLTYRGKWLAWKYKEGWFSDGRCIGWGEMVAIELALRTLVASKVSNVHLHLRSDNQGVIGALAAGKSYNAQENAILQQILRLYHEHSIWFTITYIPSKQNPADPASRGELASRRLIIGSPPKIPFHLHPFIHHSVQPKDLAY